MSRLSPLAPAILALVAVGCACGCGVSGNVAATDHQVAATTPSSPQQLTDLRNIEQLRNLFNNASGEPRLIILVSPT
jgi:hypothetical protein